LQRSTNRTSESMLALQLHTHPRVSLRASAGPRAQWGLSGEEKCGRDENVPPAAQVGIGPAPEYATHVDSGSTGSRRRRSCLSGGPARWFEVVCDFSGHSDGLTRMAGSDRGGGAECHIGRFLTLIR
jgi:hypothetical protein